MSKNSGKKSSENNAKPLSSKQEQPEAKGFFDYLGEAKDYLSIDLIGGPKLLQFRHIVNFQKGATFFWVAFLMYYYQNFSLASYVYLALHGSYGILWIIKDCTFGDKNFARNVTIPSSFVIAALLALYWVPAFLLVSRHPGSIQDPSPVRVFVSVIVYVSGSFLMFCSDAQKYYTLKYRRGLITEGMFRMNRNTNYLGEVLIYGSFAMITGNNLSWCFLVPVWLILFTTNMMVKDASLRKKLGWEEYGRNTYLFLFKLFPGHILNVLFYLFLIVFFWYDYKFGGYIIHFLKK